MTTAQTADVGVRAVAPLLAVRSMDESLRFYVDGLGFHVTEDWIQDGKRLWCWMQMGNAALMLQEVVPAEKYTRELAGRVGLGVSLNFICGDALAFYRGVQARGIAAQRPFVGNRMWVTSLKDPDGYDLHFESPTDAPEESQFDG